MRIVGLAVLASCGSSSAPAPEIASGDHTPAAAITPAELATALRIAELHPDGTALIAADGPSLSTGARMQVAVLETFDGAPAAHPVVTVVIDGRVDAFLDSDDSQLFLVCTDSRGGDPPPLYRAHVTGGRVDGIAPFAAAIAWPTELELAYEPATGAETPGDGDEPTVRVENEALQLDDDDALEWTSSDVRFLDPTAACPFPYETWQIVFDDDDQRIASLPAEGACFSQIPMFHDMACCSEPACVPGDRRALCRWPPSFKPRFEPDLAPERFTGRTFVANLWGPIAGVVRRGNAAVWIRHRPSFEGEAFGLYYVDGDAIVAAADVYVYHCAY